MFRKVPAARHIGALIAHRLSEKLRLPAAKEGGQDLKFEASEQSAKYENRVMTDQPQRGDAHGKTDGATKPEGAGEAKRRGNNRGGAMEQYFREDRERSVKYSK